MTINPPGDPLGYYARLGVTPESGVPDLKAAFRRRARLLHPDASGTGDAAAFMRLKEAYDVLADPARRAAYDRAAPVVLPARPPPEPYRQPRRGFWLAGAGACVVGAIVVAVALFHAPPRSRMAAPAVPAPPPARLRPAIPEAPLALAGAPDHYVLPGGGPAVVWRSSPTGALQRLGTLAAFAAVHAPPVPAPEGLAAVSLAEGGLGYIEATRLMPGDREAAHSANCAYFAGSPPANGEVLAGAGHGDARVTLANASTSPAVVTLRGPDASAVARVYLAPSGATRLSGLPAGPWTAEIAFGELWSRACAAFVAGERVLHARSPIPPGGILTIGPQAPDQ